MHYRLITITLLGFGLMINATLPAYAQTTTASSTQEEATTTEPNPFLPVPIPVATSTQPVATTTTLTPEPEPEPTPEPPKKSTPTTPVVKPVVKKVTPPVVASTTASSTPIASVILPPANTNTVGSVYLFARTAPLNAQATAGILGAALLSAIIGFLFVQKHILERLILGAPTISVRSVREPQAQSQ